LVRQAANGDEATNLALEADTLADRLDTREGVWVLAVPIAGPLGRKLN
jgi:hypothetical protein